MSVMAIIAKHVADELKEGIVSTQIERGHNLTGDLVRSYRFEVSGGKINGYANDYLFIVNGGIKASRIPYGNSGLGGKTSAYIDGLYNYFKQRGLVSKEALNAAFATAKVQSKEGMHTQASSKFSKDGKRGHFVEDGIKKATGNFIKGAEKSLIKFLADV